MQRREFSSNSDSARPARRKYTVMWRVSDGTFQKESTDYLHRKRGRPFSATAERSFLRVRRAGHGADLGFQRGPPFSSNFSNSIPRRGVSMNLTRSRSDIYRVEDRATLGSDPSATRGNRQPTGSGLLIRFFCRLCGYLGTCPNCLSPKAQTPGPEVAEPLPEPPPGSCPKKDGNHIGMAGNNRVYCGFCSEPCNGFCANCDNCPGKTVEAANAKA